MKILNQFYIVKFFEVIQTKETLYLVMKCICGREVFKNLVAQDSIKEKETGGKFHQIGSTVHTASRSILIIGT